MITTIVILSVLLIISIFCIINLLLKLERIDDQLSDSISTLDNIYADITNAVGTMRKIDSKGAFEADDETGTVFTALKGVVDELNVKYNIKENINE